jgi:hypothetical protein
LQPGRTNPSAARATRVRKRGMCTSGK